MGSMGISVPDLYSNFRPRMTRIFARVTIVVLIVGAIFLAITSPGSDGIGYPAADMLGIGAVLVLCLWLLWRHGAVYATVTRTGISVRNLIHTTELTWPQIESVRFGGGRPWAQLDLTNGHTLAVMAIQSADGAYSTQEARRLATLVVAHGETTEPGDPASSKDQPEP